MWTENTSRRDFIKKCAFAAIGAAIWPSSGFCNEGWIDKWSGDTGDIMPADVVLPATPVKAGPYCEGILRLKSAIHGESRVFRFRDSKGNYDTRELDALNWFLRCRDNTWQVMDPKVLETINYLSKLFGDPEIQVNSGYRSPKYNARLATRNENVARNSLHQWGKAVDLAIPGISVRETCSYALYARNMVGYGGIGYYPRSGFVHIDSGITKEWSEK